MKENTKFWLLRFSSLLVLLESLWAVHLFTRTAVPPGNTYWSLFLAPGIYLVEIILLAGFTVLLPWLTLKQTQEWLWIIAGIYAAFSFSDLWTVGFYLSPSLILTLINAAYLSPFQNKLSWRNLLFFLGSVFAQFFFTLIPFLKRLIF